MATNQDSRGLSRRALHPLRPLVSPIDDHVNDLRWLDEAVGSARVVAVGESAHFNAESYRLRDRIFRYLVQHHGFTGYAMESGFVEARMVDDWVRGRIEADRIGDVLANGLTSLMGMYTQLRDQLEWMRTHNAAVRAGEAHGSQTSFYGIDPPGSNLALLPGLDLVTTFLADADPDFAPDRRLREIAASFAATSNFDAIRAMTAYGDLAQADADLLTAGLVSLLARLETERPRYVQQTSIDAYETALHAMRLTVAEDLATRDGREGRAAGRGPSVNVRDLAQAMSVEWILQREQRIVLAAHNSHIQRYPIEFPGVFGPMTSAGQLLGERLGDDYVVITTTQGGGKTLSMGEAFYRGELFTDLEPPRSGTVDALMSASLDEPFGVDLHQLGADDRDLIATVTRQHSGPFACPVDVLVACDVIIHLPWVTPITVDESAMGCAAPEVSELLSSWRSRS